jgi:uncharacterized protein
VLSFVGCTMARTERRESDMSERNATVTWWEIQVDDVAKAAAFYGTVFGWAFQYPMGDDYGLIMSPAGDMIGGLDGSSTEAPAPEGRRTRIYVSVDDLESTLAKVASAGGTVRTERTLISEEFGYWADFTDPSGITVGLVTDQPPAAVS